MDKALFVGRHQGAQIPGVEIMEQVAVTFEATIEQVSEQLWQLTEQAFRLGADCVILQNTPPQVTLALMAMQHIGVTFNNMQRDMPWYTVINTPGERPVEQAMTHFLYGDTMTELKGNVNTLVTLLTFANPNAKVDVRYTDYTLQPGGLCCEAAVTVIVTPPMPFVFHHLERLL